MLECTENGEIYPSCQALVLHIERNKMAPQTDVEKADKSVLIPEITPEHFPGTMVAMVKAINEVIVQTGASITGFPLLVDQSEQVFPDEYKLILILGRCGPSLVDELTHFATNSKKSKRGMTFTVSKYDMVAHARPMMLNDAISKILHREHKRIESTLHQTSELKNGQLVVMPSIDFLRSIVFQIVYALAVAEYNLGLNLILHDNTIVRVLEADSMHNNLSKCAWAFRFPSDGDVPWFVLDPDEHQGLIVSLACYGSCSIDTEHKTRIDFSGMDTTGILNPTMRKHPDKGGFYDTFITFLRDKVKDVVRSLYSDYAASVQCNEIDKAFNEFIINEEFKAPIIDIPLAEALQPIPPIKVIVKDIMPENPSTSDLRPLCKLLWAFTTYYHSRTHTPNIAILGVGNSAACVDTPGICGKCYLPRITCCTDVCDNVGAFFPEMESEPVPGLMPTYSTKYYSRKSMMNAMLSTHTSSRTSSWASSRTSSPIPPLIDLYEDVPRWDRVEQVYEYASTIKKGFSASGADVKVIDSPGTFLSSEPLSNTTANFLLSQDGMPINTRALSNKLAVVKIVTVDEIDTRSDSSIQSLLSEAMIGHYVRKALIAPGLSCGWATTFDHAFYAEDNERLFVIVMENVCNGSVSSAIRLRKAKHKCLSTSAAFTLDLLKSEPLGRISDNHISATVAQACTSNDDHEMPFIMKKMTSRTSKWLLGSGLRNNLPIYDPAEMPRGNTYSRFIASTVFQICHAMLTGSRVLGLCHYDAHLNNVRYVQDAMLSQCDWAFRCDAGWIILYKESHQGMQTKMIDFGRSRLDTMHALDNAGYRRQSAYIGHMDALEKDLKKGDINNTLPYFRLDQRKPAEIPGPREDMKTSYLERRYLWQQMASNIYADCPQYPNYSHGYGHCAHYLYENLEYEAMNHIDILPTGFEPFIDPHSADVFPTMAMLCKCFDVDRLVLNINYYAGLMRSVVLKGNIYIKDPYIDVLIKTARLHPTDGARIVQHMLENFASIYGDHNYLFMKQIKEYIYGNMVHRSYMWVDLADTVDHGVFMLMLGNVHEFIGFYVATKTSDIKDKMGYVKVDLLQNSAIRHKLGLYYADKRYVPLREEPTHALDVARSKSPTVPIDELPAPKAHKDVPTKVPNDFINDIAYVDAAEEIDAKCDFDASEALLCAANAAAALVLGPTDDISEKVYGTRNQLPPQRRVAVVALGAHPRANIACTAECARRNPVLATTLDHAKDVEAQHCLVCGWRLLGAPSQFSSKNLCSQFCSTLYSALQGNGDGRVFINDPLGRFRACDPLPSPILAPGDIDGSAPLYISPDGTSWSQVPPDKMSDMPRVPTYATISRWHKVQQQQDYYLTKSDMS